MSERLNSTTGFLQRSEQLYSYLRERNDHGFLCPLEALLLLLGSSLESDSPLTSTAMKSVFLVLSWSRCMQQVTQLQSLNANKASAAECSWRHASEHKASSESAAVLVLSRLLQISSVPRGLRRSEGGMLDLWPLVFGHCLLSSCLLLCQVRLNEASASRADYSEFRG